MQYDEANHRKRGDDGSSQSSAQARKIMAAITDPLKLKKGQELEQRIGIDRRTGAMIVTMWVREESISQLESDFNIISWQEISVIQFS